MTELIDLKEDRERVILIGVSQGDGEQSLKELEDLVGTAGAVSVGQVIQCKFFVFLLFAYKYPAEFFAPARIGNFKSCFQINAFRLIIISGDIQKPFSILLIDAETGEIK